MATLTIPAPRIRARVQSRATGRAAHIATLDKLSFRAQPALAAALSLAAGIELAHLLWVAPAQLLIAGILPLMLLCWLARNLSRVVLLPLLAAWMLLGAFLSEVQQQPDPQTALIQLADGSKHTIVGEVVRFSAVKTIESQRPFSNEPLSEQELSVQMTVRTVDGQTIAGGVRLAIYAPADSHLAPVHCGDSMTIDAQLKQPQHYRDPGVWDGRAWLLGQGVSVLAAVNASETLLPVHANHGSIGCWVHALQVKASERLVALGTGSHPRWLPNALTLTDRDAGMLTAMVTGDRSYLERAERLGFERTGAFHVLVVSGLHVGLIAALLLAVTKRLGCSRGWSALLTALLATAYAIFTGFGAPVQRALAMVLLYLAARAVYRTRDAMHALGVAALCLLAWDPRALFEAGLQMTILTVVATGGLVAPMAERSFRPYLQATRQISIIAMDVAFPPRLAQFRVMLRVSAETLASLLLPRRYRSRAASLLAFAARIALRVVELLVMSATVEAVMALPMALYFHRITVLALPVNLLLIPGLGILLPVAVGTAITAIISPHVAMVPAALLALLMHLASGLVHFFARIELGDARVATPSSAHILLVLLMLACCIWALRQNRVLAACGVLSCMAAILIVLLPSSHVRGAPMSQTRDMGHPTQWRSGHALEISALDVGQGDALLVVTPDGKTLMVDSGGPTGGEMAQHGNFEIGEDVVSPVLWTRGVGHLDVVVLTHAHSDHMGGMFAVLSNFHPRELWVGSNPPTREYEALLSEANHLHVAVRSFHAGDAFAYGDMDVRVLAPATDYHPGLAAKNDDSLVLRLAYGNTSALLEGDAEAPSERQMAALPSIHSDLLKVGHHGSKTSTTEIFLKAVSPRYAVVSVGMNNLYHHPRYETLEHLQQAGVRTWRTDLDGMTTFYLDGEHIESAP
jgi:competence protein ComEC